MQQIRFTFETSHGPFSDAIYLEDDHTLTPEEIDALVQDRLTRWMDHVGATLVQGAE
jgi:hypothetical protein